MCGMINSIEYMKQREGANVQIYTTSQHPYVGPVSGTMIDVSDDHVVVKVERERRSIGTGTEVIDYITEYVMVQREHITRFVSEE